MKKPVKLAYVGLADDALQRLEVIRVVPNAVVVAVVDGDAARRDAVGERYGIPAFASQHELHAADVEHDAVVIDVRDDERRAEAENALRATKHVLCATPQALDPIDVRWISLQAYHPSRRRVFAQALMGTFMLEDLLARHATGELGDLLSIDLEWRIPGGSSDHAGRKHGASILRELGPHAASLLAPFMHDDLEPTSFRVVPWTANDHNRLEDDCHLTAPIPGRHWAHAHLVRGAREQDDVRVTIRWTGATAEVRRHEDAALAAGMLVIHGRGEPLDPRPTADACLQRAVVDLIDRIRSYDSMREYRHRREYLWSLEVVNHALHSAADLDPEDLAG
jgi:predicted dehydrogenase